MAGSDRWYFTKEVLANTPSRRCGIDSDKELSYRQQAANLIQDMGQRLHVSQLCINTAIVYMHRFYTFHSFTKFTEICALFLAAKVEEQPRKLEHVIKVSHMCLHRETPALDIKSEAYQEQAMELVFNENLMLQTLGFDIAVEHPHTSVVNCCQLVRASKDLAQTSYFMATNSLHLTTMCLQYKPTVVACVCIHLACKWSMWEIPRSSEGKDWFFYVDRTVTLDLLERLTSEFLAILDKCPSRLKRKILSGSTSAAASQNNSLTLNKPNDERKSSSHLREEIKPSMPSKSSSHQPNETIGPVNSSSTSPLMKKVKTEAMSQQSNKIPVAMSYATYRERKERANTQQDNTRQQLEQLNKPNKSLTHPIARDMGSQQRDKPIVSDKLWSKQQQINNDKQKQSEERNKLKAKNPEHLWDTSSSNSTGRPTNTSKPITSSNHPKSSQNNSIPEDFYENLVNKPSNFNSIFSTDGEDSLDFKREIATDLKMEFSDNSNQSNDGLNLTSFTSDFMNDSSDSKKSLINNNNNNNSNSFQTTVETKPTSFMSIFSTPITTTNSITTATAVHSKSDNVKPTIPSKYNDIQSVLSRIKPEPPPPMLSPLKYVADVETVPKHEKQSFVSHSSSAQTTVKTNSNTTQDLDIKQFQNSKVLKNSPKNRNVYNTQKNSMGFSAQTQSAQTFREKEVNESSLNIKLEEVVNQTPIELQTDIKSNSNSNILSNNYETIASIQLKQENKEKLPKGADVPSVLSHNRQQTINSFTEFETKPNIEPLIEEKSSPPPQQPLINNKIVASDSGVAKLPVTVSKEVKEKPNAEEKHHKHSHHSHKSSKHKDKHKHKHKDKDRERHKRKDKDRDRERDKDKEKYSTEPKDEPPFKISWSSPKDKTDISSVEQNVKPIKLKISKSKLSLDESDKDMKDTDFPLNPLKLRIQLKDQKLTTNTPEFESNDTTVGRKRKSSPKSSKKEKISKYETESNNSSKKEDKIKSSSKSKKSNESNSSSKKSSNNLVSEEKRSAHLTHQSKAINFPINSMGQQMLNIGQTVSQSQPPQRTSKAHK